VKNAKTNGARKLDSITINIIIQNDNTAFTIPILSKYLIIIMLSSKIKNDLKNCKLPGRYFIKSVDNIPLETPKQIINITSLMPFVIILKFDFRKKCTK
jgi:hypothetical protein